MLRWLILFVFISNCSGRSQFKKLAAENSSDFRISQNKLWQQNPIFQKNSNFVLMPLGNRQQRNKSSKSFYRSNYGSSADWNVLFLNPLTGEKNLLTKQKIRITSIRTNIAQGGKILTTGILYLATLSDYNQDKILDGRDPTYLFLSSTDGRNFRQISPRNETILYHHIIPDKDAILIKTRKDSNQDKKFNHQDTIGIYTIRLKEDGQPVELLDKPFQDKIIHLYKKLYQPE